MSHTATLEPLWVADTKVTPSAVLPSNWRMDVPDALGVASVATDIPVMSQSVKDAPRAPDTARRRCRPHGGQPRRHYLRPRQIKLLADIEPVTPVMSIV